MTVRKYWISTALADKHYLGDVGDAGDPG